MWLALMFTHFSLYFVSDAVIPYKTDFCKLKCGQLTNICCLYSRTKFGKLCLGKGYQLPFSIEEKHAIVDAHNIVRDETASGRSERRDLKGMTAADMFALSYGRQLEYSAGCWARQCRLTHSRCRAVEGGRLGETICFRDLKESDVKKGAKDMLTQCPREIIHNFAINLTTEIIDNLNLPLVGDDEKNRETIQIIASKVRFIGCYRVVFPSNEPGEVVVILVCQYYPKANIEGEPVFLRGPPCSKCSEYDTPNARYPNLCGRVREFDKDNWAGVIAGNRYTCNNLLLFTLLFGCSLYMFMTKYIMLS